MYFNTRTGGQKSVIFTLKIRVVPIMVLNKTACFLQQTKLRDGSRTSVTSKMELFVIIVNGFQPLTITTKWSILDVATVLDPLLKLGLTFKILTFNDLLLE